MDKNIPEKVEVPALGKITSIGLILCLLLTIAYIVVVVLAEFDVIRG